MIRVIRPDIGGAPKHYSVSVVNLCIDKSTEKVFCARLASGGSLVGVDELKKMERISLDEYDRCYYQALQSVIAQHQER